MQTTEPIWILEGPPIHVSFNTEGTAFYRGGRGVLGTPLEAHLRLIAVKGEERREVLSPCALQRLVRIEEPGQALEFARLFTSIETHYLFPDLGLIEPRLTPGTAGPGEYTAEYARQVGLSPALAREKEDSFVVERSLLARSGALYRVTEEVDRDGRLAEQSRVVIDEHSPIPYPIYQ